MKNIIASIDNSTIAVPSSSPQKASYSASFNDVLARYTGSDATSLSQNQVTNSGSDMLVGEITPDNQTVSELLQQHKELKGSTWDILKSEKNQNKDYTKLQAGTKIFYNPKEGTISWATPSKETIPSHLRSPEASVQLNRQESSPSQNVQLGVISEKVPTVSHLLNSHSSLKSETWEILAAGVNRDKDFTRLPVGTVVQLDPTTKEIQWLGSNQTHLDNDRFANITKTTIGSPVVTATGNASMGKPPISSKNEQAILLGKIDNRHPTVSHLVEMHPQLREHTWQLLGSSVNNTKPFHNIANGTEIYFNPQNMEVTWNTGNSSTPSSSEVVMSPSAKMHTRSTPSDDIGPATNLSEAVQQYFGTSYKEINCYELLVKGLQKMDIPYSGRDGLQSKLTRMALDKGMAANAYLTGEGIVEAAGSLVLSKNYSDTSNWKEKSAVLMKEIEPLLSSGQILSFSTEKRGHTGIVSQQDNQWTFINSGRLDNSVDKNSVRRGVGEEVLHREIRNWFRLAHSRGETLSVTLGSLDQGKIRTAYNMSESLANRT